MSLVVIPWNIRRLFDASLSALGGLGFVLALSAQEPVEPPEVVEDSPETMSDAEQATAGVDETADGAPSEQRISAREMTERFDRQRQALQVASWNQVKSIADLWSELPAEYFPGHAGLVEQIEKLKLEIEQPNTLRVGLIDPEALTLNNSIFWRAALEAAPDDPVLPMFEQMLWAARGHLDHAIWLIELARFGPPVAPQIHRVVYSLAEEMRALRARQVAFNNELVNNTPPEGIDELIRALLSFQPENPDWILTGMIFRMRIAGLMVPNVDAHPELADQVLTELQVEHEAVRRNQPLTGALFNPSRGVRSAARELDELLKDLFASRGAYGDRDLRRLTAALVETELYGEALLAHRRATALRGFAVPGDLGLWWQVLPNLIGPEDVVALREAHEAGQIRPVSFFRLGEGLQMAETMPLHPIMAERGTRMLLEAERRLAKENITDEEMTGALVTMAETLGHFGRWEAAAETLDRLPASMTEAGKAVRVWLALWSGRTEGLAENVAELDEAFVRFSPAAPALAMGALERWADGARIFETAADQPDVDPERGAYYLLMAAAFSRIAEEDDRADELIARGAKVVEVHPELTWVDRLVRGMAGERDYGSVGDDITEIIEAGRRCEQRFYGAFAANVTDGIRESMLEACLTTGVVDFVEYTASLIRLRQLHPERWDPAMIPADDSEDSENEENDSDWTDDAEASWSVPS